MSNEQDAVGAAKGPTTSARKRDRVAPVAGTAKKKSAYARSREIIDILQREKKIRGIQGLTAYIMDCWEESEIEAFLAALKIPNTKICVEITVVEDVASSSPGTQGALGIRGTL